MKAVGIKSLKAKLSEYLRLVKAGETVLITERAEVIAEIKPAHRQEFLSSAEQFLDDAEAKGWIALRTEDKKRWSKFDKIDWVQAPKSTDILSHLRDE